MNIPNGYRQLEPDEIIKEGDLCLQYGKFQYSHDILSYGKVCSSTGMTPIQYEQESVQKSFIVIRKKQRNMNTNEELKVTKDKVLEAAKSCRDVEKALKILFPSAFKALLPEVGQKIKHISTNREYIRIVDEHGAQAQSRLNIDVSKVIFVVSMSDGCIYNIDKNEFERDSYTQISN